MLVQRCWQSGWFCRVVSRVRFGVLHVILFSVGLGLQVHQCFDRAKGVRIAVSRLGLKNNHASGEPSKKLRVLIADDSANLRESLARLVCSLENLELVAEAGDGSEALEAVRLIQPDVAILDIDMPELNGLEVLERLRAEGSLCTVIMLTAHAEEAYRAKCLKLGAKHFFEKGTQAEDFVKALQRL